MQQGMVNFPYDDVSHAKSIFLNLCLIYCNPSCSFFI